jgi:chromosome segregation ATPase
MRSTALAYKDERDEVPMSSQEVLEANVAAIRNDVNDLKTDFRAAVARLDQRIDAAVSKLEGEIRTMAAKAEKDLKEFAGRIERQLEEMRADDRALRDKTDKNHETLNNKIDKNYETLCDKIDKTNEKLGELTKSVDTLGSKLNAFFWVVLSLTTIIGGIIGAGKAFKWF